MVEGAEEETIESLSDARLRELATGDSDGGLTETSGEPPVLGSSVKSPFFLSASLKPSGVGDGEEFMEADMQGKGEEEGGKGEKEKRTYEHRRWFSERALARRTCTIIGHGANQVFGLLNQVVDVCR